jgi:sensor histidine kinase YesM
MLSSRFGAMLKITFDIPEEIRELKIPTFSLQLLLENCVKHNIISSEHPLEIKVFATLPDSLTVENLLQPKISKVESSGYGLQSLIQRYHLLCYSDGVFIFSDDRVFRVKLKLIA